MRMRIRTLFPAVLLQVITFSVGCSAEVVEMDKKEISGLFMTAADKERIQKMVKRGAEPWTGKYNSLMSRAGGKMKGGVNPFHMEDLSEIRFGWCGKKSGPDDTLSELVSKLENHTSDARDLALAYSFNGKKAYAKKSESILLAWADHGQLLNLYDLNIDFKKGHFDGITSDGYCGDRPWNFALDTMWQCYGLISASDAFVLLREGGYEFREEDEKRIRNWIRELAEAVNSSFHAWTRWADAHKGSGAFERYRSDNHLSWSLAGLMAAAIALDDDEIARYVLEGGTWKDSKYGAYQNPSYITDVIDRAIEGDGGKDSLGRIYEEKIRRKPPMGYSFFHLWPMSLVASMAEKRYDVEVWDYKGSDGAGLKDAYTRYAEYLLGRRDSPKPEQESGRTGYAWLFEIAVNTWPEESLFQEARDAGKSGKYMKQSIGPVSLLYRPEPAK